MNRRGLTLLELMLSTAIVAVLTFALYSALYSAFHARETAQAQTGGPRQASIALDLIEQNLKSVEPPNASASVGSSSGPFFGPFMGYAPGGASTSAELDFYCNGHSFDKPDSPFAEGMRHVQIMLSSDGTTSQLVREVNTNLLDPNGETLTEEVLAKNVTSLTIQYYDGSNWTDSWDSTTTTALPLAVDITIEVQDTFRPGTPTTYKASRMIALPCGVSATDLANAAAAASSGGTQ